MGSCFPQVPVTLIAVFLDLTPETAAKAACKAAVKAHDMLPDEALDSLLEQLKNCRQGTLCPHGRPTMVELSIRELERRFYRK